MPNCKASDKDYPDSARPHEVQGDVEFALDVDKSGKPSACRVRQRSGSALNDDAACRTGMRWQFQPALDDRGEPIAGEFADWMSFNLRDDTPVKVDGHSIDAHFDNAG